MNLKSIGDMMGITNANMLKTANRRRIFDLLHRSHSPMTKQEMAKKTGLTIASVGNILNHLEKARLVQEAGQALSNGGRKPTLYTLDTECHYVVGVSIAIREIIVLITNLKGEIKYQRKEFFSLEERPENVMDRILHYLEEVVHHPSFISKAMVGIGVSAPGPIDSDNGIILSPPHLPLWNNVPIVEVFQQFFQTKVELEKDSNCMLLGERYYGQAREVQHALYFMVDAGIGSSYIVNGELYRGATQLAGEVGFGNHSLYQRGNLSRKALNSILPIVEETKERIQQGALTSLPKDLDTFEDFVEGYYEQDKLAQELVQLSIEEVSYAIADKVNFLNPELVIIGGRLITAIPEIKERVEQIVLDCVYPETAEAMTFITSTFKQEAEAIGATTLILKQVMR
ncbi:ROK family transcriptional regulator [Halobacillus sp. Marseille-P3879]|uniref:ROK family transcriptional regulator n=1 Tax=Halobacillus sp. Marseille-P3879 TaxID=2045014 RepID=UPI000C7A3E08|nr:ROK family transcriptional regulator [Halobacillus sp. Marseille-P3879]